MKIIRATLTMEIDCAMLEADGTPLDQAIADLEQLPDAMRADAPEGAAARIKVEIIDLPDAEGGAK